MEKVSSPDTRFTTNDQNDGQTNGQTFEFDSFVEDFEREADEFMPAEDEIVSLARRDVSLDAENLRALVVQHAHLLSKETAAEFNALILNAPYGTAKYRIGLLKPLSADDKRRFSRILKVYSTSETVIKFQMLDSMLFQILMSEAYEQKNIIRKQKRREQQQTRETRVWGSDGSSEGNKAATQQAKTDAQTVEELSGKRVDISDMNSYYEIQNQINRGVITEYSLETFTLCKFLMQDFTLSGASDMHFDSTREGGRVRYRNQGVMYVRLDKIPPQAYQQMCYCLCIWGGKDPAKMKRAGVATVLQMLVNVENEIKPVEYRFQSNPTLYNPSITLRGQAKPLRDINKVGFSPIQMGDVMAALSNDRGIIVVTGPTGSGKTNTLNCILAILEEDDTLAITELGSPIEIESPFRRQITVPDTASETQNEIIRQQYFMDAMRSDPDVICYTEIRSADESKTAFRAAVTGHLVLTTLHA
ncbi:MAG TPA: ATPase, T2SS/T4P/T4SS family, partial [Pyrinomonadaceae bacterium]|nr:ATPase, T2SS/T4P/T4SS family [Pyrinomonadaceae bacterium]